MTPTAKILVVDDEENIRTSMQEMLADDGYQVVAVDSGEEALALVAAQEKFDLALLDLKLDDMNGIDVLAILREQSPDTVVIVLTAYASLETAVEALRHGAHDYLFKPCKIEELQESIRRGLNNRNPNVRQQALMRQLDHLASNLADIKSSIIEQQPATPMGPTAETPPEPINEPDDQESRFLQCGPLVIDSLRHVITVDGQLIDLSSTEFDLLAYLIRQTPRVVPLQELTREVQKYESEPWEASEAIRQHVYRIRQKIKEINREADVIRTVRGVGYAINE